MTMRAPIVVLVRPQMGENIGMAARAMANFGLGVMRLVAPRDGWGVGHPVREAALDAAVGARAIVEAAPWFPSVEAAIADCHRVHATTARGRDQAKPVLDAEECVAECLARGSDGQRSAVLFGPERTGLDNEEVALADTIVSYPVDPAHPSINLAQAVGLLAYEWRKTSASDAKAANSQTSLPAPRAMAQSFHDYLVQELEASGYFLIEGKEGLMRRNLINIFLRLDPSEADIRTLRGAVTALSEGRRRRAKP
jgi:tRNA/rRNA methyltransferase